MTLKLGYLLPTRQRVMEGDHDTDGILELGDFAEEIGLDSVWIGDSVIAKPRHDPITLLAAIAARTERIALGTAVLVPMLRNPILLAHQLATLDRISRGRFILGVGLARDVPAIRAEFEAVGVPFEKRVGRMLEGLRLCRALWSGESVDWDGRWTLEGATLAPEPFTPGGPKIWGGGGVRAALRRCARNFDGWFPSGRGGSADWGADWNTLRAYAGEAGRDPAEIAGAAYVTVAIDDDRRAAEAALDSYLLRYYNLPAERIRTEEYVFAGNRAAVAGWLAGFVEAGCTHLCVRVTGSDDVAQMEELAELRGKLGCSICRRPAVPASCGLFSQGRVMTLKLGYLLPTRERVMVGVHDTDRILELGDVAEAVGLDSVWIGDSLIAKPRHDPITLLAAIAARTERVALGTAVLLPMLRNPTLLAHQLATLDRISRGRFILGVGTARDVPAIRAEFEAAGVPFEKRIGRMLEGLRLCRALWSGEPVDWDGRWKLEGAMLAPEPHTPGGPKIWGGGGVPAALRRCARNFDGWFPSGPGGGAEWDASWRSLKADAADAGRDPAEIVGAAYVTVAMNDDPAAAEAELDSYLSRYYNLPAERIRSEQYAFAGDRSSVAGWLAGFVEAGCSHLCVRVTGSDDAAQMEELAGLRGEIG